MLQLTYGFRPDRVTRTGVIENVGGRNPRDAAYETAETIAKNRNQVPVAIQGSGKKFLRMVPVRVEAAGNSTATAVQVPSVPSPPQPTASVDVSPQPSVSPYTSPASSTYGLPLSRLVGRMNDTLSTGGTIQIQSRGQTLTYNKQNVAPKGIVDKIVAATQKVASGQQVLVTQSGRSEIVTPSPATVPAAKLLPPVQVKANLPRVPVAALPQTSKDSSQPGMVLDTKGVAKLPVSKTTAKSFAQKLFGRR